MALAESSGLKWGFGRREVKYRLKLSCQGAVHAWAWAAVGISWGGALGTVHDIMKKNIEIHGSC